MLFTAKFQAWPWNKDEPDAIGPLISRKQGITSSREVKRERAHPVYAQARNRTLSIRGSVYLLGFFGVRPQACLT